MIPQCVFREVIYMESLERFRLQIDRIDQEMQRLFLERMTVVSAIAALKKTAGLPIYDADREADVLRRNKERIDGSPFSAAYERFLHLILSESKQCQATLGAGGR